MPELPEVEACRRVMEYACAGARVSRASALEGGGGPREGLFDEIVFSGSNSAGEVEEKLRGRKVNGVKRKGKHLWVVLDGADVHPVLHFGMTGNIRTFCSSSKMQQVKSGDDEKDENGLPRRVFLQSLHGRDAEDGEWPPRFTKLELELDNGYRLAFTDPRRLGRIVFRKAPHAEPPISLLAPDPLTDPPSQEQFQEALCKSQKNVKTVLLAQNEVVCGVGNWLCDDICYRARIHPAAKCSTLSLSQSTTLHEALLHIVHTACQANADSSQFPPEWLFHCRWQRDKGGLKDFEGKRIDSAVVGGRTTLFVPGVQRMGDLKASSATANVLKNPKKKTAAAAPTVAKKSGQAVVHRRTSLSRRAKRGKSLKE